ncbi:MAG: IS66 family transposase [Lautropia sp.]
MSAVANDPMIEVPKRQFDAMVSDLAAMREQLAWFKRQVFGVKSEKRLDGSADQANLFTAGQAPASDKKPATVDVPAHKRQKHRTGDEVNDSGLRFGADVPVREIVLPCPELAGPDAEQYELIDHKVSLRLARQPGSHVVLKYLRPVVRRKADGAMSTVAAPLGVLDHAQIDVSFVAGVLVDKFVYHVPLYRQHQRLADEGIVVARSSLDAWARRSIDLLGPICKVIWEGILQGDHLKIDETPIKAGRTQVQDGPRAGQGKMKTGWLWPVLGENGDIAFGYSAQRGALAVKAFLGEAYKGTIQTDGYQVYADYAAKLPGCIHALCWSHTRRSFLKAEARDKLATDQALEMIRALYAIERRLKEAASDGTMILEIRHKESRPVVEKFFAWVNAQIQDPSLTPKSPLAKALAYAKEREAGLKVFLTDAWLDLDTNDLERALRVIPMGRKNWLFCSSETGAKQLSTIQTILATCRRHDVDPYTYLVDVLQRINELPASRVAELTPREWVKRFADNPLRSDLAATRQ